MKYNYRALIIAISTAAMPALAADSRWDISKLDASKLPPAATASGVTYLKDIRPLFEASCFRCHGEQRSRGGLRLDNLKLTLLGGDDGKVVVPGASDKSLLVMSISQLDKSTAMPPKPRARRSSGQGGPGTAPPPPGGSPDGKDAPPPPQGGPEGGPGRPGRGGPPAKPLTSDQVALVRAWIDQGAK